MPVEARDVPRVPLVFIAGGVVGGLLFAAGGAVMGSMNAGWLDLRGGANFLFPLLGLGVLLTLVPWVAAGWPAMLWRVGGTGPGAVVLLALAPALYVLSWVIEFAIFGTFALGGGLILLAVTMCSRHLEARMDRVLVTVAAVGSLTWNTETTSAFLLVAVGLVFAALCLRLRPSRAPIAGADALR